MTDRRSPTLQQRITLLGFTVETTSFETTLQAHDAALAADSLDIEYDVYLSDMASETVIVEPDGNVLWPHRDDDSGSLLDLIEPILKHIPTWALEQYVAARRGEEE